MRLQVLLQKRVKGVELQFVPFDAFAHQTHHQDARLKQLVAALEAAEQLLHKALRVVELHEVSHIYRKQHHKTKNRKKSQQTKFESEPKLMKWMAV